MAETGSRLHINRETRNIKPMNMSYEGGKDMRRNSIRGKRGVAATVLAATLALLLLAGCKTEGDDQPPAVETVTVTFKANAPAGSLFLAKWRRRA